MSPLNFACINPHLEGGIASFRLKIPERLCPRLLCKLPPSFLKEVVSAALTTIGITVISGVCYLTLCRAHPIFASEGAPALMNPSQTISFKTKTPSLSKEQIEENEYYRWKTHTDFKYKGKVVSGNP